MPLISRPKIPDRVRKGYEDFHALEHERISSQNCAYSSGWLDAVKQIMGLDSWFACICDLNGNALPEVRIALKEGQDA